MQVKAFYCPHCGGTIKFDLESGRQSCFCLHCGQQVILDDEVVRSEHTEIKRDEARIKEADVKAQIELEELRIYQKELEQFEKNKKRRILLGIAWAVVMILIFVITVIINNIDEEAADLFGISAGGVWPLVGLFGLLLPSLDDNKPLSPAEQRKKAE